MSQRQSQRYLSGRNCRFQLLEKRFALSAVGLGSGIDHGSPPNDPLTNPQHSSLRHPHQEIRNVNQTSHRDGGQSAGIPKTESNLPSNYRANDISPREDLDTQHHRRHHDHSGHLRNSVAAENKGADLTAVADISQPDRNHPENSVLPPVPASLYLTLTDLVAPTFVSPSGSPVPTFSVMPAKPTGPSSIPLTSYFMTVDPVATQDRSAEGESLQQDLIAFIPVATVPQSTEVATTDESGVVGRESHDLYAPTDAFKAKGNNGDRDAIATHLKEKNPTGDPVSTDLSTFLGSRFTFEQSRDASFAESLQQSSDAMTAQSESLNEQINDLDKLLEAIAISRATRHPDSNRTGGPADAGLHTTDSPLSTDSYNPDVNPMILLSPAHHAKSQILSSVAAQETEAMAIEWGVSLGLHRAIIFADPLTTFTHGKAGHKNADASENPETHPAEPDPPPIEIIHAAPHGLGLLCSMMVIPYLRRWYRQNHPLDHPVEQP